ncbi:hypothetical protein P7C71_g4421, partial [Lecanoromycetidae sp. Uapishka_2]
MAQQQQPTRAPIPGVTPTSVCGIFSPARNIPPVQLRPGGTGIYQCPRCDQHLTRQDSLRDHFPVCIRLNGNPGSLVVTDHQTWGLPDPRHARYRQQATIAAQAQAQAPAPPTLATAPAPVPAPAPTAAPAQVPAHSLPLAAAQVDATQAQGSADAQSSIESESTITHDDNDHEAASSLTALRNSHRPTSLSPALRALFASIPTDYTEEQYGGMKLQLENMGNQYDYYTADGYADDMQKELEFWIGVWSQDDVLREASCGHA